MNDSIGSASAPETPNTHYFCPSYAPGWNLSYYGAQQSTEPIVSANPVRVHNEEQVYEYSIRVIDPKKRSNYKTMAWHDASWKFNSIQSVKAKIAESFPDDVSHDLGFQIGYYHGRGSTKRWLVEERDLMDMYKKSKNNINLWCEGICATENEPPAPPAKKPRITKREAIEDEVDEMFTSLKSKHPSFALPKLRLWARLIRSGHHEDYDTPPNIPLITGSPTPAKGKKESMSDAFAGAAKAIVDVLKSPSRAPTSSHVSPMKSAQLRRSCLEDLKKIKELFEDRVLSQEEFIEQKKNILTTLKSLQ